MPLQFIFYFTPKPIHGCKELALCLLYGIVWYQISAKLLTLNVYLTPHTIHLVYQYDIFWVFYFFEKTNIIRCPSRSARASYNIEKNENIYFTQNIIHGCKELALCLYMVPNQCQIIGFKRLFYTTYHSSCVPV